MHQVSPVRWCVAFRIRYRVAQVHVARRHVDLRPQRAGAVGELPRPHPAQEAQVLLDRTVPVRALPARLGQGAAVGADLVRREVVHVGLVLTDELLGPLVELLEVVARVIEVLAPVEAEPAHGVDDGVDVLLALLGGIGVVEAEVAAPAKLLGDAEVEADRLGVSDVQISVRLGRKARDDRREATSLEVLDDRVADEVGGCVAGLRLAHLVDGITTPSRPGGSCATWRRV